LTGFVVGGVGALFVDFARFLSSFSPCPSPNPTISTAFAEHAGAVLLHILVNPSLHILLHQLFHLLLHLLYLHLELRTLCLLCGKSRGSRRKWPACRM
jgi:hypothetical protein